MSINKTEGTKSRQSYRTIIYFERYNTISDTIMLTKLFDSTVQGQPPLLFRFRAPIYIHLSPIKHHHVVSEGDGLTKVGERTIVQSYNGVCESSVTMVEEHPPRADPPIVIVYY